MTICRTAPAALLLLLAAGCARTTNTSSSPEPNRLRAFIKVNEPGADAHFLNDVNPFVEGGSFRWTHQNPMFQFQLPPRAGWKLKFDYAVNAAVLKATGPLTVTFFINGAKFDQVRYEKDVIEHYEKSVPAGWLSFDSPTIVSVQLDKVLETPDHNKLGLVLTAAGFAQ